MPLRLIYKCIKLTPCPHLLRGYSQRKVALLLIAACLSIHLHWRLAPVDCDLEYDDIVRLSTSTESTDQSDVLGCSANGEEIIYNNDVRVLGKPLTEKVYLTIGIPTVERSYANETVTYIETTMDSLIEHMSPQEMKHVLIVVFLADLKEASRRKMQHRLGIKYKKFIDSNLIHVIQAPKSFYPSLTGIPNTASQETPERLFWRAKQNMDYIFLFKYCEKLSTYYLQMEDDVTSEDKFIGSMDACLYLNRHVKWTYLQMCYPGFIGKLFRNEEIDHLGRMIRMFYDDMPCDWLLYIYKKFRGDEDTKDANFCGEFFHHIGKKSSRLAAGIKT